MTTLLYVIYVVDYLRLYLLSSERGHFLFKVTIRTALLRLKTDYTLKKGLCYCYYVHHILHGLINQFDYIFHFIWVSVCWYICICKCINNTSWNRRWNLWLGVFWKHSSHIKGWYCFCFVFWGFFFFYLQPWDHLYNSIAP